MPYFRYTKKPKKKNIYIEIQELANLEKAIPHDTNWICESIYNLLDNSIKYSPYGSKILITMTNNEMFTEICVEDFGIGIREGEENKIFQRFYRGDNAAGQEGYGMGLYITRDIIQKHDGFLRVRRKKQGLSIIVLPLRLDGRTVDTQFLELLLQTLGLAEKRFQMPNTLSGGQQQRVAIARSLITRPAVVLADEPTGNLDSRTSLAVISLMKSLSEKFHQTLIAVTHSHEIAQMADQIIRIEDGKIRSDYLIDIRAMGTLATVSLENGSMKQYRQMEALPYIDTLGIRETAMTANCLDLSGISQITLIQPLTSRRHIYQKTLLTKEISPRSLPIKFWRFTAAYGKENGLRTVCIPTLRWNMIHSRSLAKTQWFCRA